MTEENPNLTKPDAAPADPDAHLGRASSFSLDVENRTIADSIRGYVFRLRTGEPGALPAVLGLVVLGVIFMQVSSSFLTKNNIGNQPGQGAYIAVIALGLIFVLLLGEIDLSSGTLGGLAAGFAAQAIFTGNLQKSISGGVFWSIVAGMAAIAVLGIWLKAYSAVVVVILGIVLILTNADKHVIGALIAAVALGTAVGILNGFLVAKVGIPSFIVTLAVFIAWQGMLQFVLTTKHATGAQPVGVNNYSFWYGLAHSNMSKVESWIFIIVVVGGYLLYTLAKSLTAARDKLTRDTIPLVLLRGGIIVVVGVLLTWQANTNRNTNAFKKIEGIPWAASVPIVLMIVCSIALSKSSWGRHLYATGGNQEAARRAGIDVDHIKVTAFALCSGFGALGGIFLASNTGGAQLDLGAGNTLLFSVAAAVIGGTSLFGGRGKPRDAILGALVIVIIPDGLNLHVPSYPIQYQEVVTGAVLLVAAGVDALTRRRSRIR
jgi:D-xylose transport system permease protein